MSVRRVAHHSAPGRQSLHPLRQTVIVATHMLESMIENPLPTRAEVTDVANAVFEQADAIMLSGETTIGKYPLECIEVLSRISQRIERSGGANYADAVELHDDRQRVIGRGRDGERVGRERNPRLHSARLYGALHLVVAPEVHPDLRVHEQRACSQSALPAMGCASVCH